MCVCVYLGGERERQDGLEVAETDKPVTKLVSENCKNIDMSW